MGPGARSTSGFIQASGYINADLMLASSGAMDVDGSSSTKTFSYAPPDPEAASIARMFLYIETAGAMDSGKFGDITNGLTNGIQFRINDVVASETTNILNWKLNEDMLLSMYDFSSAGVIFGKTTKVATGRLSFFKATGMTRGLYVPRGGQFEVIVQDNLTSLTILRMRVQGHLVTA